MIIKVCGMRDAENIRAVEQTGADWMGFIFYKKSPRYVSQVPDYLPQQMKRVGVFVNPTFREVMDHVNNFGLHAVQFHGNTLPDMCQAFRERGLIVIRALPVVSTFVADTAEYMEKVDYFLFDTPTLKFGGSGRTYDWQLLQRYNGPTPFLLSGGLSPHSVASLQTFSHPYLAGYDLNSGFETAPALKDATMLQSFIKQIK